MADDVELPPRPVGSNIRKENTSHDTSITFDGDGEFGSQKSFLLMELNSCLMNF